MIIQRALLAAALSALTPACTQSPPAQPGAASPGIAPAPSPPAVASAGRL